MSEFAEVAVGTNVAAYTRGSNFTFDASVTLAEGTSTVAVVATDMAANTVTNEYELPLTAGDDADFYYDLNGNLTSIHRQASSIAFEWDALDRLISWSEGTNRAEFVYDGQDRRVVIRDISGSVTNEKQLLWCGSRICQERDENGAVSKHYFSEGFELLSGANAGVYFYGQDHLGSVRELIDTTGTVQTQYDYDSWGRRTKVSGTVDADFGYTLHYYHQPSRLSLAKYRTYNPHLGRWLSRDPIGFRDGPNLSRYVLNDPVNRIDPLGLLWCKNCPGTPGSPYDEGLLECAEKIYAEVTSDPSTVPPGDIYTRTQHCIASCRVTRECPGGSFGAAMISIGYNWGSEEDQPGDKEADKTGRGFGRCKKKDCYEACHGAWDNNELPKGL